MSYEVGDQIAHPLHGAGVIDHIERHRINGVERDYYVLRLPVGDMVVMIPEDTCDLIGVRPVIDAAAAERLLAAVPDIEINMTANWNKRYRENMLRIRSGNLMEVAAVVKGLMLRDEERGLSTGERKMLHSARQILLSELVLALHCSYEDAEQRFNSAFF